MKNTASKPAVAEVDAPPATVSVRFETAHTHAGTDYKPGDSITVARATADRIAVYAQVEIKD